MALVLIEATSEPAEGSVTAYDTEIGWSIHRPRYLVFCASFPARITGTWARSLAPA